MAINCLKKLLFRFCSVEVGFSFCFLLFSSSNAGAGARQTSRELTNRRLLHDAAVRLRDMLSAHAFLSTCQLRAKGDDVGESDLPASCKQEDVRLVFKIFSRYFGYFCQII